MLMILFWRVHWFLLAVKELVKTMVRIYLNFRALGLIEDGFGERSLGNRKRLAKTCAALCGNASFAIVVSWVCIRCAARERRALLFRGEQRWQEESWWEVMYPASVE